MDSFRQMANSTASSKFFSSSKTVSLNNEHDHKNDQNISSDSTIVEEQFPGNNYDTDIDHGIHVYKDGIEDINAGTRSKLTTTVTKDREEARTKEIFFL